MLWQPEIEQASWLQESSPSGYGFLGARAVQQPSTDRSEGKMQEELEKTRPATADESN